MKYGGLKISWAEELLSWQLGAEHPVNPLRGYVAVEKLKAAFPDAEILEDWAEAGELGRSSWQLAAESIQAERVAELQLAAGPDLVHVQLTMFGATYVLVEQLLRDRSFEELNCVYFSPAGGELTGQHEGVYVLNDMAWAAKRLAGADLKVAYVDLDAHHSSEMEQLLRDEPEIWTCSVHELSSARTNYSAEGFLNAGLAPGAGDPGLLAAVRQWLAQLSQLDLDVLLVNAGADGLAEDESSLLGYTPAGLTAAGLLLGKLAAEKNCSVLISGGGGQLPLDGTPEVWEAVVSMFVSALATKEMQ